MQNNNLVENENQRPTSDGLEVKMYLGLFGFAVTTLAISFAIMYPEHGCTKFEFNSWYENQFRTWLQSQPLFGTILQDYELIYQVAFLIYMAIYATGIFVAIYQIIERFLAFPKASWLYLCT